MVSSAAGVDIPAGLRGAMVDKWAAHWQWRIPAQVENAMRAVPRHLFLPGVSVERAYAEESVVTHRDTDGVAISSASQPGIVAMMLEQLDVRPGQQILEIGAGTGYNAALLAYLTGPSGAVTTIDIDSDVADGARRSLAATGYEAVHVICGDGQDGWPAHAPYDRIIVTAGAWDLPPTWREQLAPRGRIVVPLRMQGLTRSVALERDGGCWRSRSVEACGFVPIRGADHYPEVNIPLDADGNAVLRIDDGLETDAAALRRAVGQAPARAWTGVTVTGRDLGDLDYWLAGLGGFCRLLTPSPGHGLASPVYGWGSMALLDRETFAYITRRPAQDTGECAQSELGICAYGPAAEGLANRAADRIRIWAADRQSLAKPWIEIYPAGAPSPSSGKLLVIDKPHVRVIVRAAPARPGQAGGPADPVQPGTRRSAGARSAGRPVRQ